jgi:hypothetical protein
MNYMFLTFESLELHKAECYEIEALALLLNVRWNRSVFVSWLKIRRQVLKTSKVKTKESVYSLTREVFLTRDHLKYVAGKIADGYARRVLDWIEGQEMELKKVKKRIRSTRY